MKFNDVPVTELLEDLGFLVDLVNLVCLLKEVANVDCFDRHYLFRFLVHRSVHFTKAALPKQLVD